MKRTIAKKPKICQASSVKLCSYLCVLSIMALMCNAAMATDPALPDDAALPSAIAPWEGLRDILRDAQLALLPSETPVVHDLGELLLLPDGTLLPVDTSSPQETLLLNLQFTIYNLSLYEDPGTHATVFLDGDGALLHELPAEEGYSPAWVYNASYNLQLIIDNSPDPSYDPSLVTLTATLSDPFDILSLMPDGTLTGFGGVGDGAADADGTLNSGGSPSSEGLSAFEPIDFSATQPTNAPLPTVEIPLPPNGVIYVDAINGDDAQTGRSAAVIARSVETKQPSHEIIDGPKRTLHGGLSVLDEGGTHALVIREGDYPESIDLRGRDVFVKIEGNVRIGKAARSLPPAGKRPDDWVDIPPSAIPTNTVRHLP